MAQNPSVRRDRAAEFVALHQRGLWRWLRVLGCEPTAAEEHCQDALLAALHHGLDARPEDEARRWLRTAARNLFFMQLRAQRRRPTVLLSDAPEAAWLAVRGDDDGGEAAGEALAACLEALAPREGELLAQRYAEQAPRAAMAARFGLGEAGVKQALRRLRAKLKACIERRLQTEDGR